MFMSCLRNVSWLLLVLSLSIQAYALDIRYDEYGRPTQFRGLEIDDAFYYVAITWDTSMAEVYGEPELSRKPPFYGDQAATEAVIAAMKKALLQVGFNPDDVARGESYIWIPYGLATDYLGVYVDLKHPTLPISTGTGLYYQVYVNVGFVSFQIFSDSFETPVCPPQIFYVDKDGDGYGDDENFTRSCLQPPGTVTEGGDCNDDVFLYTTECPLLLCTETCPFSDDGGCDDGGPLSDYSLCDLGTDCIDCGVRTQCPEGLVPDPENDGECILL